MDYIEVKMYPKNYRGKLTAVNNRKYLENYLFKIIAGKDIKNHILSREELKNEQEKFRLGKSWF
ncbi:MULTISPECIES: hypothetical protein [unclassified Halanaerobium]|uniref:hypothetical protein n=1 Tax=unclassified Halanaerobium TaxID=2641197 RepID=UPI0011C06B18|nr:MULTISPECIES: hypothetical protein [unclassified Halanaerobium]